MLFGQQYILDPRLRGDDNVRIPPAYVGTGMTNVIKQL